MLLTLKAACVWGPNACLPGVNFLTGVAIHHVTPLKASATYAIGSEEDIMEDVYNNGPVQATFLLESELYGYSSGVYVPSPPPPPHTRTYMHTADTTVTGQSEIYGYAGSVHAVVAFRGKPVWLLSGIREVCDVISVATEFIVGSSASCN
jgi:hypothetical protein